MDTTFITIQDLTSESRILYVSNSVFDILGYIPEEVVNHSSWDFFHPEEITFARNVYGRGIKMDKAAVLNYARLRGKNGQWIGCECVFSIVNDVLVGCISQYKNTWKSQKRAMDAPIVRQLFSSSPKDPRYHMLSYISNKFTQPHDHSFREPRAAIFLNRFTRTLPIMFASNGLQNVLGISSDQLHNKSFYYCIQENCLPEAIRCLESAKANDSIAYLRFWYRDPRIEEGELRRRRSRMASVAGSDFDDEDGGVPLAGHLDNDHSDSGPRHSGYSSSSPGNASSVNARSMDSSDTGSGPSETFDRSHRANSSNATTPFNEEPGLSGTPSSNLELEAVVSCTSDGLVVILRQARPFALDTIRQRPLHHRNGIFASPWASEPILPTPARADAGCVGSEYLPSGEPIFEPMYTDQPMAHGPSPNTPIDGPRPDDFMRSIREVAVFAWALTGLNGCLDDYSHGPRYQGAVPAQVPVWERHIDGLDHPDMIMSG